MTRTAKTGLKSKEIAQIRREVKQQLLEQDIREVRNADIDAALNWASVRPLVEDAANQGDLSHVVENIVRYLPRTLQRHRSADPTPPALPHPKRRELDTRHAMSYALAISALKDVQGREQLRACRRHYWSTGEAPFLWLNSQQQRQVNAREKAMDWLEQNRYTQPQPAFLQVNLKVACDETSALKRTLLLLISDTPQTESAGVFCQRLGSALEQHGAKLVNLLQWLDEYIPDVDVKHSGFDLVLGRVQAVATPQSYLWELFKTTHALTKRWRWPQEDILRFILTGEPPSPHKMEIEKISGTKRPKYVTFDHIALLQLVYATPGVAWRTRLSIWDNWLKTYPEEQFTLLFQSPKPDLIASNTQRARWMTNEYRRAYTRASDFLPLVQWKE